jgi:hypothetical protein
MWNVGRKGKAVPCSTLAVSMPAIKKEKTEKVAAEPYPTTPTKPKKKGPPMSEEVKAKLKALRADRKARGEPTRVKRRKSVSSFTVEKPVSDPVNSPI